MTEPTGQYHANPQRTLPDGADEEPTQFWCDLTVTLWDDSLDAAIDLCGKVGMPATLEAFVARAIAYGMRANHRNVADHQVQVVPYGRGRDLDTELDDAFRRAERAEKALRDAGFREVNGVWVAPESDATRVQRALSLFRAGSASKIMTLDSWRTVATGMAGELISERPSVRGSRGRAKRRNSAR